MNGKKEELVEKAIDKMLGIDGEYYSLKYNLQKFVDSLDWDIELQKAFKKQAIAILQNYLDNH